MYVSAHAVEEIWYAFGIPYGFYSETGSDIDDLNIYSIGFLLNQYTFTNNKNIGLYTRIGYKPIFFNNDFAYASQLEFLAGVGYRMRINEDFNLHFGLGLAVHWILIQDAISSNEISYYDRLTMGLGADLGFKWDITKIVFFNTGVNLIYNFICWGKLEYTNDDWITTTMIYDNEIKNYSLFGIRPYIAIGFNFYSEKGHWGRP
jgi:hypothetical protein